jgi:hypothetical protein
MGVPREDLLLMMRALKRGFADVRSIRKALDRQVSRPIGLLEALHLPAADQQALRGDASLPDLAQDRPQLEALHAMLVEGEDLTAPEWEKFVASLTRPSQRHGHAGLPVPQEFDGYALRWELARRERGVVFRATAADGREAAIKVFRKDVPVQGLPLVDGHAYAAMPFEEGESLEGKRPSARRAAQAALGAARALRDRPHGALTPARILVRKDDSVAVVGFEHAKAVPPSARAAACGPGDDVRALGAILYELLTGSPPAGEVSPAARTKDADADVDRIVSCALTGGYASMAALADDLARYLKGEPVTGRKRAAAAASAGGGKPWIWLAAAALPLAAAVFWFATRKAPGPDPVQPPPVESAKPPAPAEAPKESPPKPETARKPAPVRLLSEEEERRLGTDSLEALGRGDWAATAALAGEALARGSKQDWPVSHLARVYLEREELDKALEYVTRALDRAPASREALEMRAEAYARRGEARKALEAYEGLYGKKGADLNKQIIRLSAQDAKDPQVRLQRGIFFCLKRNYDRAADDFTAAVELGKRRALAWRAHAFLGLEDRARAKSDAEAYLREFPADFATEEVKTLLRGLSN